jgi:hypothetical protein
LNAAKADLRTASEYLARKRDLGDNLRLRSWVPVGSEKRGRQLLN